MKSSWVTRIEPLKHTNVLKEDVDLYRKNRW